MGRPGRRTQNIRLLSVGLAMLVGWSVVGYRLYTIQGSRAAAYAERGIDQRLHTEELAAARGTIFDRHGRELAVTVDAITVYANPHEITQPYVTAQLLGPMVGEDVDDLAERLAADSSFVYVRRQLERRQADRVRAADFPGIHFTEEPARVYPAGDLAAHVIGLVQVDNNRGLEGLERQYDEALTGVPGRLLVERDPDGRSIPQGEYRVVPARPGSDLVTTIDAEIQYAVQQTLAALVDQYQALGGTAVVLDPTTGQVLAMANVPTFDPNDRRATDPASFRNRAVTDLYEPGSTQKLITVAAALDAGAVTTGEVFDVPEGLTIDDKEYEDVGEHPPALTVADIVAYSSNIGTILIQRELGNDSFHEYLGRFGLGRQTAVDFPGEAEGVLPALEQWCAYTCGPSTAIGYNVSVTVLQMAAAFGAIANDGVWISPHLVMEVVDERGSRRPTQPVRRTVVTEQTAAQMRELLAGVVEKGTGYRAAVTGYRAGGKTGTTTKFHPDLIYDHDQVVASFIGMAPIEDPRLVVAVTVDSPNGGQFGGEVAAPAFAEIMEAALHQLGVPPETGGAS